MDHISIIERTKQFMDDRTISMNELSKEIGKSVSAISAYLSGKYKGDADRLGKVIDHFLKMQTSVFSIGRIYSSGYVKVMKALKFAESEKTMTLITGDWGVGKTTAVKDYVLMHESILIESDSIDRAKSIFKQICRKLRLDETGSAADLRDRIISASASKLLIIDEAENLAIKTLDAIRRIGDKSRFTLVLVGSPDLWVNLERGRTEHGYLMSRIGFRTVIPALNMSDVDMAVSDLHIDSETKRVLLAQSGGKFRTLLSLIRMSLKLAKQRNTMIDRNIVITAKSVLFAA